VLAAAPPGRVAGPGLPDDLPVTPLQSAAQVAASIAAQANPTNATEQQWHVALQARGTFQAMLEPLPGGRWTIRCRGPEAPLCVVVSGPRDLGHMVEECRMHRVTPPVWEALLKRAADQAGPEADNAAGTPQSVHLYGFVKGYQAVKDLSLPHNGLFTSLRRLDLNSLHAPHGIDQTGYLAGVQAYLAAFWNTRTQPPTAAAAPSPATPSPAASPSPQAGSTTPR